MTKIQSLLLTSFESPAVIVPECQPDRIHSTKAAYFIEVNHVILQEFRKYTKREFIERYSPYQPGEKLIGKVKCINCESKIIQGCQFCSDGYSEQYIQLSSNIEEWQLMELAKYISTLDKNKYMDIMNSSPQLVFDDPYVFIIKQEVI